MMLFFWTIFDGIVSYTIPLVVSEEGFTKTILGLIISSSSIAGAFFDFLLSKYLVNTHYRRLYLMMFAVCFIFPFLLWHARIIWVYFLAMAMWGLYYDLNVFGTFDFVGRLSAAAEHSTSFGIIEVFKGLGYLIAPILTGLVIGVAVDWKPFVLMWLFLLLAVLCFGVLLTLTRRQTGVYQESRSIKPVNFLRELSIWRSIGQVVFPVLVLTMFLNILDAFYWTIGPIFSESLQTIKPFNGFFMTAYTLPPLLVGWVIGSVTGKMGKKRSAFLTYLIGSLVLIFLPLFHQPVALLGVVFLSSFFTALAWPSINGAYADYIAEAPKFEKEITGLEDFFANGGYIVGPVIAGILADLVGNSLTFSFIGVMGAVVAIWLLRITPREIRIPEKALTNGPEKMPV
jgi:MFS family permease